jgi:hypothetical protein
LSSFTLEVVPLYNNYNFRSERVLEEYRLLDPSFTLNTIKVANNPSGSNAKRLFMYNRDKSILYYSSTQQKDFIVNLNIAQLTFGEPLKNGRCYSNSTKKTPPLRGGVSNLITGISDAECSFLIILTKRSESRTG